MNNWHPFRKQRKGRLRIRILNVNILILGLKGFLNEIAPLMEGLGGVFGFILAQNSKFESNT